MNLRPLKRVGDRREMGREVGCWARSSAVNLPVMGARLTPNMAWPVEMIKLLMAGERPR